MKIENGPPQRFAFLARVGAIPYLFFALIIFLLWASYFEIDQTVRVQGQLVSESKTQIIQSADGGVIEKIFVREGDAVKAGKVVARLEQTRASAEYEETRTKAVALEIAIARVKAEANGSNPDFSKFPSQYKHVVNYQRELYQTRLHNLKTELGYIYEGTDLALKEHQMNERLFASGDISATDALTAPVAGNQGQERRGAWQVPPGSGCRAGEAQR
jgi:adhesin transport system membrane fusion protein